MKLARIFRLLLMVCVVLSHLPGCRKPSDDPAGGDSVEEIGTLNIPLNPSKDSHLPFEAAASTLFEAFAAVSEYDDAEDQRRAADDIASRLTSVQVREWMSELILMPASPARDAMLKGVLGELFESNREEALRIALSVQPGESAKAIASRLADIWTAADHEELFKFIGTLPKSALRDDIWRIPVRTWSSQDLDDAFGYIAGLSYENGGSLISIPASRLGQRDSTDAIDYLDQIKDPRVWDSAAGWVFSGIADQDPDKATEWFLSQDDTKVQVPLAYAIGASFAGRSVPEGVELLNQIHDDVVAHHFLHGMIHRLNKGDMEELLTNIPLVANPDYQASMALSTARDLSGANPDRVRQWIPTILSENTRAHAYQGAAMTFAGGDAEAAQAWIRTIPPGKDRRYATFGFASEYSRRDPEVSVEWAMTIRETNVRERLLRTVLWNWNSRDSAAAAEWAQANGYQKLLPHR